MSSFEFQLGQRAAARRDATQQEQTEPPTSGTKLEEWRRGYGGKGLLCPIKNRAGFVAASVASVSRQSLAVKDSRPGSALAATEVRRKQAALFDAGPPAKTVRTSEPKLSLPMPVPLSDVEHEIALLVSIGIGLSEADHLVRKQRWTLDQLVCQWQLGNEAGLPQSVIGRVAQYGQQKWGPITAALA